MAAARPSTRARSSSATAAASGSIVGNVTNNGTFAINRSDTYHLRRRHFRHRRVRADRLRHDHPHGGQQLFRRHVRSTPACSRSQPTPISAPPRAALAFGGGTLQFLSGFTTSRAVTLNGGGGTFDTNGNSATLAGVIGGTGGLTKIGDGTLTLAGANTYSGRHHAGGRYAAAREQLGARVGALTTTGSVVDYASGVTIANRDRDQQQHHAVAGTSGTANAGRRDLRAQRAAPAREDRQPARSCSPGSNL